MNCSIIEAKEEHVEGVLQLWKKLMGIHTNLDGNFFSESKIQEHALFYRDNLEVDIKGNETLVLIAKHENEVIAYLTATIESFKYLHYNSGSYCTIGDIMVDEKFRGGDVGKSMIERVKTWARTFGACRVELNVFAANTEGYGFFKKIGFEDSFHLVAIDLL